MTKAHALVIDDNPQNIEVLARLLAVNDVTHTAVQDTSQLDEILENIPRVDIVFLDIEMPIRSGYEVLTVLRNKLGHGFPIIACTVHLNEVTVTREMGFDGFIAKPINPQQFSTQLEQILSGKPVWDVY